MDYGVWPEWLVYTPPSAPDLPTGGGNVARDVAREVLSAVSGLTLLGPKGGVIWRGHATTRWRLESKLGRAAVAVSEIEKREKEMIVQAREIGADNAQHLGDWEILARLRHHGAATRLIDFTSDPLVALWFLCNDASAIPTADGEVSASKMDGLLLALQRESLGKVANPFARNYDETIDANVGTNLLYRTPPIDVRIAAQRGLFVFAVTPKSKNQCAPSELGIGPLPNGWKSAAASRLGLACDTEKWARKQGRPIEKFPTIIGILVPAAVKPLLLSLLETHHGFAWSTMFPDFAGMGEAYAGALS